MAIPDSSKVTLRGDVQRPLTYSEMDENFDQLKEVVDQSNRHTQSISDNFTQQKLQDRSLLKRQCAEAGLTLVDGSFEEGASVNLKSEVVWQQATGKVFAWFQDAVKTVAAGSTPETTGGISAGAWVDRTDLTLRSDLASESGSGLVGYQPAGTGAVATTVQSKLRESVSVKDFGAVGDGVTDDTAAIQAALNASAAASQRLVITNGSFSITGVSAPANTNLCFDGGKIVARNTTTVLTIAGSNVTVENPVIDLNSQSYRGIFALSVSNIKIVGTARVFNAKTGGSSYNGGMIFESVSGLVVDDVIAETIYQNGAGIAGLYRAFELNQCSNFSVGTVYVNGADISFNIPDSSNGFVNALSAITLTDNGVYMQGTTSNVTFGDVKVNTCGEGVVFNCSGLASGIHFGSILINTASAKGLALRTGGGYHIGSVTLIEANMEQLTSYSPAVSRMVIGSLRVYQNIATAFKPINLFDNDNITFGTIAIDANAPLNKEGMRFTDCDRIVIGSAVVRGIGGTALSIALRITDGSATVADPYFMCRTLTTENVTTPLTVGTATKTNITVYQPNSAVSNLTLQKYGAVTLQLENLNNTLTAGDVIGLYQVYGNDASAPGVKVKIETQATGGNGGFGLTYIKNDGDATVAIIPANAVNAGMTVKLPTASTGLSSGMIWNNAGTINIVP